MSVIDDGTRYAMARFPGDGVKTDWEINFVGGYLSQDDVYAYSYVTENRSDVTMHDLVFLSEAGESATVRVTPAIPVGRTLTITRETERGEPLVDFTDNAMLTEQNLDTVTRQAILSVGELTDLSRETATLAGIAYDAVQTAAGDWGNLQWLATRTEMEMADDAVQAAAEDYTDASTAALDVAIKAALLATGASRGADMVAYSETNTVGEQLDANATTLEWLTGTNGATGIKATQNKPNAVELTMLSFFRLFALPEMYGAVGNGTADDTDAINRALEAHAGGKVTLTPGKTYGIGSAIILPSGTELDCRGAIIKRIANSDNMIRNKMDGVSGGWGATERCVIRGGVWDGNGTVYTTPCTLIAIGHASYTDIIGTITKNVPTFHHIEINGSRHTRIMDGIFLDGNEQGLQGNEAIQIDHAYSGSGTWFAPYDDTICVDVLVRGCRFINTGTCIGTHSGADLGTKGLAHDTVTIEDCKAYNPYYCFVRCENWSGLTVSNCRSSGGAYGILCQAFGTRIMTGPDISNVHLYGMGNSGYAFSDCRGIRILGTTDYGAYYQRFSIKGCLVADLVADGSSGRTATHGITVDWAQLGDISGNLVNNTRGAGIYVYAGQWIEVDANVVRTANTAGTAGQAAIIMGNQPVVRCRASGNICNTLRVAAAQHTLAQHNDITDASGLTTSGNATTTTVSQNLINGVYT